MNTYPYSKSSLIVVFVVLVLVSVEAFALYTPKPGNPVRKAVLDGMRGEVNVRVGHQVEFLVKTLLVEGQWAWVSAIPQTPGGAKKFERWEALLQRHQGAWYITDLLGPTQIHSPNYYALIGKLAASYPQARAVLPGTNAFPGNSASGSVKGVYTPRPGNHERKAILDAVRPTLQQAVGIPIEFVVQSLLVKDGWAWLIANPQSKAGANKFETIQAPVVRRNGKWRCLDVIGLNGEFAQHDYMNRYLSDFKQTYPGVPAAILPPTP